VSLAGILLCFSKAADCSLLFASTHDLQIDEAYSGWFWLLQCKVLLHQPHHHHHHPSSTSFVVHTPFVLHWLGLAWFACLPTELIYLFIVHQHDANTTHTHTQTAQLKLDDEANKEMKEIVLSQILFLQSKAFFVRLVFASSNCNGSVFDVNFFLSLLMCEICRGKNQINSIFTKGRAETTS